MTDNNVRFISFYIIVSWNHYYYILINIKLFIWNSWQNCLPVSGLWWMICCGCEALIEFHTASLVVQKTIHVSRTFDETGEIGEKDAQI
jgi:hypothetical protein